VRAGEESAFVSSILAWAQQLSGICGGRKAEARALVDRFVAALLATGLEPFRVRSDRAAALAFGSRRFLAVKRFPLRRKML